jgi:hypothetical protein
MKSSKSSERGGAAAMALPPPALRGNTAMMILVLHKLDRAAFLDTWRVGHIT